MKTNKEPEPKELFQQHHKEIGVLKIKKRSKRGWAKKIEKIMKKM